MEITSDERQSRALDREKHSMKFHSVLKFKLIKKTLPGVKKQSLNIDDELNAMNKEKF